MYKLDLYGDVSIHKHVAPVLQLIKEYQFMEISLDDFLVRAEAFAMDGIGEITEDSSNDIKGVRHIKELLKEAVSHMMFVKETDSPVDLDDIYEVLAIYDYIYSSYDDGNKVEFVEIEKTEDRSEEDTALQYIYVNHDTKEYIFIHMLGVTNTLDDYLLGTIHDKDVEYMIKLAEDGYSPISIGE